MTERQPSPTSEQIERRRQARLKLEGQVYEAQMAADEALENGDAASALNIFESMDMTKGEYFRERIKRIKSGEPTWLARNFFEDASENNRAYDLYIDSQPKGLVERCFGYGCLVYVYGDESPNQEIMDLPDAVELMERRFGAASE